MSLLNMSVINCRETCRHLILITFVLLMLSENLSALKCHTCGEFKFYKYEVVTPCAETWRYYKANLTECSTYFDTLEPLCYRMNIGNKIVRGCTEEKNCPESRDNATFRCCQWDGCNAGPIFDVDLRSAAQGGAPCPWGVLGCLLLTAVLSWASHRGPLGVSQGHTQPCP